MTKATEIAHLLEAWRSAERAADAAQDAHRLASEAADRAAAAAEAARGFATAAAAALEASGASAEIAAHQAEMADVNHIVSEVVRHDAEQAVESTTHQRDDAAAAYHELEATGRDRDGG